MRGLWSGSILSKEGKPVADETGKYQLEHKQFLADALAIGTSQEAIAKFAEEFKTPFNRNMLAGLFNKAGGKEKFIEKYRTKAPEAKKPKPAPVVVATRVPETPAPLPKPPEVAVRPQPQDVGAKKDQVIAQALLDWDPYRASFANVYSLAAMMVNQKFGTSHTGNQIEAEIRKKGGILELLFDCGVDEPTARKALELAKQPKPR
jgi:hypothetical protein